LADGEYTLVEVSPPEGHNMPVSSWAFTVSGKVVTSESDVVNSAESAITIPNPPGAALPNTGGVGTTGQDCRCHCGLHVFEDQYITEVIDPVTGKVLPDGEYGELVFTSLTREAMPIIRYRTHDISRIVSREKCACGRTSLRIDRITGRTDDMLIVKGVNFYPRQVEQALKEIPGVADEFQIILEERHGMTEVTINVEAAEGVTGHTVAKHLRERLGFLPKGDVFPIGSLPRTEGKAKRVIKKVVE
jgi:phenylacetate-CoA ligase